MKDYRYLLAFLHTARLQSFSKAAEFLGVAQSAISRQVKLLEQSLGHELLLRSSKSVILTSKGEELLKALEVFEKTAEQIFEKGQQSKIRIGILQGLLTSWLSRLLPDLCKQTGLMPQVITGPPTPLVKQLEKGELDAIITNHFQQSDLLTSLKLFEEEFILVSKDIVELENIEKYKWIAYASDDYIFRLTDKKNADCIIVQDQRSMLDLVESGLGVAVVPAHVSLEQYTLNKQPLPQLGKASIYLTTHSYKELPPHLKGFTDYLKTQS